MKKKSTTNTFQDGLVMDFNPLIQPQSTLSNALNATLITMNGNENILLNDMGNGRVESAYLPEGYVPVGTCSFGGVIYIASYNPFTKKCQLGSFPSPERNITSSEVNDTTDVINETSFYSDTTPHEPNNPNLLLSPCVRILVYETPLNPGDKYLIVSADILNSYISGNGGNYSYISALGLNKYFNSKLLPRYIRIAPISIGSNGSYTDLSDTCVWQEIKAAAEKKLVNEGYYYIYTDSNVLSESSENLDIDEYRDLISSNYNVFSSKYSGLLGILAELECIDTFSAAWDAYKTYSDKGEEIWNFYFFLNWTYDNDMSPDKINLYGVHVDGTVTSEETDDTDTDNDTDNTSSTNARKVAVYRAAAEEEEEEADPHYLIINQYPYHIPQSWVVTSPGAQLEEGGGLLELADVIDPENPENPFEAVAMYGVLLGNTDIMQYLKYIKDDDYVITFLNPPYIDSLYEAISNDKGLSIEKYIEKKYSDADENDFRKNNGSDNQYLLSTPFSITNTTGILTMDVTPTMPYGEMAWLKLSFRIDLEKLGTGIIELCTYKYYVDNNTITLQWGLDAYVEMNRKILGVDIDFFIIDESVAEWLNGLVGSYEGVTIGHIDNHKGMIKDDVSNWVEMSDSPSAALSSNGYDYIPVDKKVTDIQKAEPISHYNWSSYSGNFTETLTFNNLTQYTTYLVRIRVDYDGDYIDFYRIMYTEPIFNNYYYKTEYPDYAVIKLSDVTSFTFNAANVKQYSVYDTYKEYEVTNTDTWAESKVSQIPSYYETLPKDTKTYCINNEYDVGKFSASVESHITNSALTVVYNSFAVDISLNKTSEDNLSVECTVDNSDATMTPYVNSGLSSGEGGLEEVNSTFDGEFNITESNTIEGKYNILTHCPLSIEYNKLGSIPIPYIFSELITDTCFIMGCGSAKRAFIGYSAPQASKNIGSWGYKHIKDDSAIQLSLADTSSIYDGIKDLAADVDVVCVGAMMYSNPDSTKPTYPFNMGMIWGAGDLTKKDLNGIDASGATIYSNFCYWNSDLAREYEHAKDAGAFAVFYVMLNSSGIPVCFTYAKDVTLNSSISTNYSWFNTTVTTSGLKHLSSGSPKDKDNVANNTSVYCCCPAFEFDAYTKDNTISEDIITAPFENLYKVIDYNLNYSVYEWSVIYYYPRFTQNVEIDFITIILVLNVTINNKVNLRLWDSCLKYINNFNYNIPEKCSIKYGSNRTITINGYVDNIASGADRNLIAYEDDDNKVCIVQMEINNKNLFKKVKDETSGVVNFNMIDGLPNIAGTVLQNGTIRTTTVLGYVRVNSKDYKLQERGLEWLYEEQGIAIYPIYVIPPY